MLHFQPCRYDRWSQALDLEAQRRLTGLCPAVDAATAAKGLRRWKPQSTPTLLRSAARGNAFKS
jgi:hypothetical protein